MPSANNNNDSQDTSTNETESNQNSDTDDSNNNDNNGQDESAPTPLPPCVWTRYRSMVVLAAVVPPPPSFIFSRRMMNRPTADMTPEERMQRSKSILDEALAIVRPHNDLEQEGALNHGRSRRRSFFPPSQPKE